MTQTYFLLRSALPAFLSQQRATRDPAAHAALKEAGLKQFRFFDAEAFSAMCSDVMMMEGMSPVEFHHAIERLRESPVVAAPWFRLDAVIPTLENAHHMMRKAA